jgi:hypothetical protein
MIANYDFIKNTSSKKVHQQIFPTAMSRIKWLVPILDADLIKFFR